MNMMIFAMSKHVVTNITILQYLSLQKMVQLWSPATQDKIKGSITM